MSKIRKDEINKEIIRQLGIRKYMEENNYKTWTQLGKENGITREAIRQRAFHIKLKLLKFSEDE